MKISEYLLYFASWIRIHQTYTPKTYLRNSQSSFLMNWKGPSIKEKIIFSKTLFLNKKATGPLSSRGGGKALMARLLKKNFFCAASLICANLFPSVNGWVTIYHYLFTSALGRRLTPAGCFIIQ